VQSHHESDEASVIFSARRTSVTRSRSLRRMPL
jgi:hypothetical protein